MRSKALTAVFLMSLLFAVQVTPVAADARFVADPDDAKGFLDIKRVAHRHADGRPGRLRHTITTFESWNARDLRCAATGISFKNRDRYVRIYYEGGLKAEMLNTETQKVIGQARVWRPNSRSVRVQFPKRWLGSPINRYRWLAVTETYGGFCPPFHGDPPEHRDLSPNSGWILHVLAR